MHNLFLLPSQFLLLLFLSLFFFLYKRINLGINCDNHLLYQCHLMLFLEPSYSLVCSSLGYFYTKLSLSVFCSIEPFNSIQEFWAVSGHTQNS